MSLDGVIQTDGTDFEAFFEQIPEYAQSDNWITEAVDGADVLVVGRNAYVGMAGYFPSAEHGPMVDALNRVQKIVMSKTLTHADWGPVTICDGELGDELERLRQGGDGYVLIQGGATLLKAVAALDSADEYWIGVCPYVAGSGPHLFSNYPGGLDLELHSVESFGNGIVAMKYRRVRSNPR